MDLEHAPKAAEMAGLVARRLGSRAVCDVSGVWRYRELVLDLPPQEIVSFPEGRTNLYALDPAPLGLAALWAKHEGENPTGSFKDRGMTVAVSQALHAGARALLCASTGNTAASLAAYGARAHVPVIVLLSAEHMARGKLAQSLAYGAHVLQIDGGFDDAMAAVAELAEDSAVAVMNSLNPFRLEGQKTIILDTYFQLGQMLPDWIVVPGGNLGNTSAFGKALFEMQQLGFLDHLPRLAVVQAEGAAPFVQAAHTGFRFFAPVPAETVATAIRIGNPVNYAKAVRALGLTQGVAVSVSDREILQAKHDLDRQAAGCEPASAATLAGLWRLMAQGTIREGQSVLLILTGNLLKDPDMAVSLAEGNVPALGEAQLEGCANRPQRVSAGKDELRRALEGILA